MNSIEQPVSTDERALRNEHAGAVVWLTGLSAAGKTTLANALERELFNQGRQVYVLDGDNMRQGLCSDLDKLDVAACVATVVSELRKRERPPARRMKAVEA